MPFKFGDAIRLKLIAKLQKPIIIQTMTETQEPCLSKPVLEMLTVANEYCLFFEKAGSFQKDEILAYFMRISPLLYLKATTLPEFDVTEDSYNERFVTEEQWENIFKNLRKIFGDMDVFYVLDLHNDTRQASLAENMADIYQDMKDFVMLYQKNSIYAKENAVSEIRQLMITHWGPRAIDTLRACHQLTFLDYLDHDILSDDHDFSPV